MQKVGDHAVVLGAGMAGLLAARVAADAYERVTVVERDPLPDLPIPRRGVPQGRHAHNLVRAGASAIDELFPGLLGDLEAGGAPVVRDGAQLRFAPGGHLLCLEARDGEPLLYQSSQPFLEGHLRARVRALPGVELVDECECVGLVIEAAADRVTGVHTRRRSGDADVTLSADVVIDATGRSGRSAAWLATSGYERPSEERLPIKLGYASRHVRLRPDALGDVTFVAIGAEPGRPTGFVLLALEEDRWILTLIGYEGHHPPTDPDGFLAFVETVAPPDVFTAIRDAESLDGIVAHQFPASLRRRYDRLSRFPAGWLAFGDALCSTNPVYALGMSVAALQAQALRSSLRGGDGELSRRFFRAAAGPIDMAWQLSVGADLALPQVRGSRPLPVRVINSYVDRVLTAAERDPVVAEQFLRVASLQSSATSLFRPSTAVRTLLGIRRRGAPNSGAPARPPSASNARKAVTVHSAKGAGHAGRTTLGVTPSAPWGRAARWPGSRRNRSGRRRRAPREPAG